MHDTATAKRTSCPRCGYDLRGVVASWTASCPLEGTCAECGLTFRWDDLFTGHHSPPPWNVEAEGRSLWRTAPSTLVRSFVPRHFWRGLRLEHQPRWRRITRYLLLFLPLLYVGFAVGHGVRMATEVSIFWPGEAWESFWKAAIFPWSADAFVPQTVNVRAWWTPKSPQDLLTHWLLSHPTRGLWLFTLTFLVMAPLVFIVLPIARRRAKVRTAHLIRIALYGLPLLVPGLLIMMCSAAPMGTSRRRLSAELLSWSTLYWLVLIVTWLLVLAWWITACRRYLRMEWSVAVGTSVVVIATCCGLVAVYALDTNYFDEWLKLFMRWSGLL